VLTLHDAWLLAGHCAHSFDCERWKSGCGQCPDLSIYPSIQRDGTRENWRRKRDIFERCRLFASTPCQWLMDKVEQSMLRPAIIESRVIPNGVDQTVFRPGDRRSARQQLGIDPAAFVLLFSALGLRTNPFKDCTLLLCAIKALASKDLHQEVLFLALGQAGPSPQIGRATVRFVPPVDDPRVAAVYYQASDVYVHAARADTFPTSILEALSCGIPVAATAVGGICEQVKAWPADDATGVLTPQGDALALAEAIARLLLVNDVRARMGDNAFQDAGRRFNLDRQVEAYLNWYRAIISRSSCGAGTLNRSRAGKSRIRPNAWVIPAAASP
jgi:glycosyltransferase involved in cell wall biosynthesis